MSESKLLDRIRSPHQLRRLGMQELRGLAREVRERVVEVVSRCGGHLASNLGVAELTIALHYVFDFSRDRLVWDVGHQCYAHKILTGRAEQFDSLRQPGGLSGFPAPSESPYDLFATGHAGSAISLAAGLAWADQAAETDARVVAVVGDASIVNGLALEGINNAAMLRRQFLIILNDNSMAIDRTSGALARVLDRVRLTRTYSELKESAESLLHHIPLGDEIADALRNLRDGLRTTVHGGQIFEGLGLHYFGPIDGHDIPRLVAVLRRLAGFRRPALLHLHTQKGRGCDYAVEDPCRFHSTSAYTVRDGKAIFAAPQRPTWTEALGEAVVELGRRDPRVVAITAAMPDGTGLSAFRKAFPDRFIDVGISESHAVAMAGGLAKGGQRPVVAIYSTFLQRAVDQVFQEVALQDLPVIFCVDRAGLVGSDGATHQGAFDIAMLRSIPRVVLVAPADAAELRAAMEFALSHKGPVVIRYPRDEIPAELPGPCPMFRLGRARVVRDGDDGAIIAYGAMVEPALQAAEVLADRGLRIAVVSARFAKPLDAALPGRLIGSGKPVLVCEDHALAGGFGSAVLEQASGAGLSTANVRLAGIPDRFIEHAPRQQQLAEVGLDATALAETIEEMVRSGVSQAPSKRHARASE